MRTGLSRFHKCNDNTRSRGTRARDRSHVTPARRAQGVDEKTKSADTVAASGGKNRLLSGKLDAPGRCRSWQAACALLAPPRWRSFYWLWLARRHARSRWRLDQRIDLPRAGAKPDEGHHPIRSPGPARRHYRQKILGQRP